MYGFVRGAGFTQHALPSRLITEGRQHYEKEHQHRMAGFVFVSPLLSRSKVLLMNPEQLRFAKTHEWVAVEGDVVTVGISDFAVKLLTDIVFLALPAIGKKFSPGESMGEIESVKAVSDVYAPVSGEILEVNEKLPDNLGLLNESPFENAWIAKIRMSNPEQLSQLMSYSDYQKHCENDGH